MSQDHSDDSNTQGHLTSITLGPIDLDRMESTRLQLEAHRI